MTGIRDQCCIASIKLTIERDREADGRWIAEVPEWNVLPYGDSRRDAVRRVQPGAREIILDRIAHGELPPDSAVATFDVAACQGRGIWRSSQILGARR
jgi:predicted RNase H-like HicB family nuclease